MRSTADTAKAIAGREVAKADLKLEVVVIPVVDAERSKAFYDALGWRARCGGVDAKRTRASDPGISRAR